MELSESQISSEALGGKEAKKAAVASIQVRTVSNKATSSFSPLTTASSSSSSSSESDSDSSTDNGRKNRRSRPKRPTRPNRKLSTPNGGIAGSNSKNIYGITLLEKLIRTHPIWFLPKVTRDESVDLLASKESGAFIIRQSSQTNTLALSVRLSQAENESVEHYLIQQAEAEAGGKLSLESSEHSFDNVLSLVYHYSTNKNELPTVLKLPCSIKDSNSRQHLSSMALLGKDYWKYPMSENGSAEKKIKPRRKLSEPVTSNLAATATLEETLNGLQKVSDMLQASLKDLEKSPPLASSATPPAPPPRTVSSSPQAIRKTMDAAEMLRSNQPIVQLRSKLSQEMFGTGGSTIESSETRQWYSYYRSSIADKMSDYEDIWNPGADISDRCLSPAESELQFKAYLANKLAQEHDQDLLSSLCSSDSSDDDDLEDPEPKSSTSSTRVSSFCDGSGSCSSSSESELKDSIEDSIEESETSEDLEVIYSDPLDALEQATDTRIYCCPEFGHDEADPIYEEAGKKLVLRSQDTQQQQSKASSFLLQNSKRRKRATISSAVDVPSVILEKEEKKFQRRSMSCVQQNPSKLHHKQSVQGSIQENKRLSAVVSKYFKPIQKQTWQMDSSSWEFLNQDQKGPCKRPQVDSGLDSTLSFTNDRSEDKDSLYDSELGTLNHGPDQASGPSQLCLCRQKIQDYVMHQLTSEDFLFGKMIKQFLDCTGLVGSQHILSILRNIRQFMNGMKNYLMRHGEGELHELINEERTKLHQDEFLNVDLLLEETMHNLVIGPLTTRLREALAQHLTQEKPKPQQPLFPDGHQLELSSQTKNAFRDCIQQMKTSVSPLDKLAHLLTGLKVVTNSVGEKELSDLNAEKFCFLLAQLLQDLQMTEWIEIDLELLWNLLPQSVLRGLSNGEATYYLTLVSSAANINRSGKQSDDQSRQSLEFPTSLVNASLKSSSSTASGATCSSTMLSVTIPSQESKSGHFVTKNVPLRNDSAKVKDVCAVLAHMLAIPNPIDYTLFSIVDGKEAALHEDERPILVVDQARLQGKNFCAFAFQRKDSQNAWPLHMGIDLSKPPNIVP